MTSKIELPIQIIAKTEVRNRRVHDGLLEQALPVETLWGIYRGHLAVGWHVLDLKQTKTVALWAVTSDVNDPVQLYRAYLIAQKTKMVSRAGLSDLARVFHAQKVEGDNKSETWLLRDLGPKEFNAIRTAVDPEFELHLEVIVTAAVPIYLGGIFSEVDAGRIMPTPGLRPFGIMPKSEREAADQRLAAAITRWTPHFEAFAEQFHHGPLCIDAMTTGAVAARRKGVEDDSLAVGPGSSATTNGTAEWPVQWVASPSSSELPWG